LCHCTITLEQFSLICRLGGRRRGAEIAPAYEENSFSLATRIQTIRMLVISPPIAQPSSSRWKKMWVTITSEEIANGVEVGRTVTELAAAQTRIAA
jgi:hypothetical protein